MSGGDFYDVYRQSAATDLWNIVPEGNAKVIQLPIAKAQ